VVDLREARKAAARVGIGLQYVLKEARVFDIWDKLSPLWTSDVGKTLVVSKGGTALNKIYLGPLQRFSEDLDLDILFEEELDRKEKIEFVKSRVFPLLSAEYTMLRERVMKEVLRFICRFTNEMGNEDNIRVEFNFSAPNIGGILLREARSEILKTCRAYVQTYSLPTLIAQKIKAFYERESGKDLYDIYYGLRTSCSDMDVATALRSVLGAEGIDFEEFSRQLPKQLTDEEKIRRAHSSANPYIPRSLRIDWVTASREVSRRLLRVLELTVS